MMGNTFLVEAVSTGQNYSIIQPKLFYNPKQSVTHEYSEDLFARKG